MSEEKKERWHRWDHAWKIFLNPSYPWHKQFIGWLLGDNYVDYLVILDDLKFVPEDPAVLSGKDVTYADCILTCEIDSDTRKLHFEFQSTYDKSIAFRSLRYQMGHIASSDAGKSGECYHLSDSVIVAVKSGFNYTSPRTLELHLNGTVVKIEYPVVYGYKVVPGLNAIMDAEDNKSWAAATRDLLRLLKVPKDNSLVRNECLYACKLIADERAYSEEGVEKGEVMKNISEVVEEFKTIEEWAEERGIEKGVEEGMQRRAHEDAAKLEVWFQQQGYSPVVAKQMAESILSGEGPDTDASMQASTANNGVQPLRLGHLK